jgi:remodeling and spacing factor 1
MQPLGKDLLGRRYWHLLDDDCNLRVYREDLDDETWELVSRYQFYCIVFIVFSI